MNGIGPPIRENTSSGDDHLLPDQEFEEREGIVAPTLRADRRAIFDENRELNDSGKTVRKITLQLCTERRRVERWVNRITSPERNILEPKSSTPAGFGIFLEQRRREGVTNGHHLFREILERDYTGSYRPWRQKSVWQTVGPQRSSAYSGRGSLGLLFQRVL